MRSKTLIPKLLIVGLTLGTAWAVRGQFGHEQGAAWAGAVGVLSILVIARRRDWNRNLLGITLAGAIGWGLGGMMSYGLLVGYGHSEQLKTAGYGLAMVAVVGALHGFLGGGLFGLALSDWRKDPVPWWLLAWAMIFGSATVYQTAINEFGWRMTPPRSEAWAFCFGIALVITGYCIATKRRQPLRIAIYSALGAGFGFAFGNVLHRFGLQSGISFNFWNVMEYSIGFFGGIGMAWGTFTASWPDPAENVDRPRRSTQLLAFTVLAVLILLRIWTASFSNHKLQQTFEPLGLAPYVEPIHWGTLLLLSVYAITAARYILFPKRTENTNGIVKRFFFAHFLLYILLSLLATGALFSSHRVEQYLYLLNFAIIAALLKLTSRQTPLDDPPS